MTAQSVDQQIEDAEAHLAEMKKAWLGAIANGQQWYFAMSVGDKELPPVRDKHGRLCSMSEMDGSWEFRLSIKKRE